MIPAVRRLALVLAITTVVAGAAPSPASALDPAKAICSLTGLISTLAGKACTVAAHPGRIIGAGKKLLDGHLGGALGTLTGGTVGRTASRVVGLATVATAVVGGARWALKGTAEVIGASTRPNLSSTWFSASYWRMAAVSALLTLPFLFAATIQAMVRSDLGMLARAAFGYLPLGLLAVGVAAPLTMLLLAGSDELSTIVSSASGHAGASFLSRASAMVGGITLGTGTLFVAFFVGLLTAAATIVLWVELLIRDAAIYVIVLMLPLFFAALVWPTRRIWALRAVELLVALILSKFAIVAVLALGGVALGHAVLGPASMLAGATLVLLAAFSPWALLRLLPLHEVASAAVGGLRSHPQHDLLSGFQRGHGVTDAAERTADELPARMRDWAAHESAPPDIGDAATIAAPVDDSRLRQPAGQPAAGGSGRTPGETAPPGPAVREPWQPPGDPGRQIILGPGEFESGRPPLTAGSGYTPDPGASAHDPGIAGPHPGIAGPHPGIAGPHPGASDPRADATELSPPTGPNAGSEPARSPDPAAEDRDPTPPAPEPDGGLL